MSRTNTPATSYHSRRPENATTPKAQAMNSLSAIGSRIAPNADDPNRRAIGPSRRSVAAATATIVTLAQTSSARRNSTASGRRTAVRTSAAVQRGDTRDVRGRLTLAAGSASGTLIGPNIHRREHVTDLPASAAAPHDSLCAYEALEGLLGYTLNLRCSDAAIGGCGIFQLFQTTTDQPRFEQITCERGGVLSPHLRLSGQVVDRLCQLIGGHWPGGESLQFGQHG